MLGVLTCPGIFPTVFAILWRRQTTAAAIISPLLRMVTGIAVWLGSAAAIYGTVSIASSGETAPCVYGTVASAFSPVIYSIIISLYKPQNYDWNDFRKERLAFEVTDGEGAVQTVEELSTSVESSQQDLKRWGRIAAFWSLATFLGHWVLWPLPMYASKYIFSKAFYSAWLIIAIIWLWGTLFVARLYPLIDGRDQILAVFKGITGAKIDKRVENVGSRSSSDVGVEVSAEKTD